MCGPGGLHSPLRPAPRRTWPRVRHRGAQLAEVGLDEEAPPAGEGAADAVAVRDAVAELAERVGVARDAARAHSWAPAWRLRPSWEAAAVELDDRHRVERLAVPAPRRRAEQLRPQLAILEAVEHDLQEQNKKKKKNQSTHSSNREVACTYARNATRNGMCASSAAQRTMPRR